MDNLWIVLIIESVAVALIGCALHFAYELSGENKIVGIFAAVNESTWEHVKLALSGIFVCTLVDVWFLGDNPNYWLARSASFVVPVVVIPLIFYSYTKFTGKPILSVDIGSFLVTAFLGTLVFIMILQMPAVGEAGGYISMAVSVVIMAMYLSFTRFPLRNFLFQDPINHHYGYAGFHRLWKKRGIRHRHK